MKNKINLKEDVERLSGATDWWDVNKRTFSRNKYPNSTISWSYDRCICVKHAYKHSLYTPGHAFMQTNKKNCRHSHICSILLVSGWLTVDLSDKTEAQANTHSPHLADHFPLVLVCQKQQPRLSFHSNPKLTSKVLACESAAVLGTSCQVERK